MKNINFESKPLNNYWKPLKKRNNVLTMYQKYPPCLTLHKVNWKQFTETFTKMTLTVFTQHSVSRKAGFHQYFIHSIGFTRGYCANRYCYWFHSRRNHVLWTVVDYIEIRGEANKRMMQPLLRVTLYCRTGTVAH